MTDTSVQKIDSANSPKGQLGQKYLASGKTVSMRLWEMSNQVKPKNQQHENMKLLAM